MQQSIVAGLVPDMIHFSETPWRTVLVLPVFLSAPVWRPQYCPYRATHNFRALKQGISDLAQLLQSPQQLSLR